MNADLEFKLLLFSCSLYSILCFSFFSGKILLSLYVWKRERLMIVSQRPPIQPAQYDLHRMQYARCNLQPPLIITWLITLLFILMWSTIPLKFTFTYTRTLHAVFCSFHLCNSFDSIKKKIRKLAKNDTRCPRFQTHIFFCARFNCFIAIFIECSIFLMLHELQLDRL